MQDLNVVFEVTWVAKLVVVGFFFTAFFFVVVLLGIALNVLSFDFFLEIIFLSDDINLVVASSTLSSRCTGKL
jgi:hypothetical protein